MPTFPLAIKFSALPSAKGRRIKHSSPSVGQAFMACRSRQGPSPCPTISLGHYEGAQVDATHAALAMTKRGWPYGL
ncbi:MAG: hypothetical protein ACPL5I_16870 [Thermodesulfobacteriota bacterium]